MHSVAWCYHLRQCRPCTWESQVCLVQYQLASQQLQRLRLLSLSEHQITRLTWPQIHHSGGLHRSQLHWPSSVFLLCLGVWVPCPWVLSVCFSTWASNVLTFCILDSGHPLLGMMICQVGETSCSVHMSVHCLLEVFFLGEVCFASVWHWLFSVPSIPWPQGCLRWQCVCGTLQASLLLLPSGLGLAASWLVPCHLGLLRICTGHSVPFHLLSGNCIDQQELGDGQQVHLVTLQVRCEHLPVGRFCSVVKLHGPLLMTGSPWMLKLASSFLQSHQLCQLASNSQTSCGQCCPGNWAHTPVLWSWVPRWDPLVSPLECFAGWTNSPLICKTAGNHHIAPWCSSRRMKSREISMVGSVAVLQLQLWELQLGLLDPVVAWLKVCQKSVLRPLKVTIPQRAVMWCISITTRSILMKFWHNTPGALGMCWEHSNVIFGHQGVPSASRHDSGATYSGSIGSRLCGVKIWWRSEQ